MVTSVCKENPPLPAWPCNQSLVLDAEVSNSLGCFQASFLAHLIVLRMIVPHHGFLSCVFLLSTKYIVVFFFFF